MLDATLRAAPRKSLMRSAAMAQRHSASLGADHRRCSRRSRITLIRHRQVTSPPAAEFTCLLTSVHLATEPGRNTGRMALSAPARRGPQHGVWPLD